MLLKVTIYILCFLPSLLARDLPSNFPRCYKNDANLDDCLLKATNTVRPLLLNGVKEIGFSPIEPLVIPSVTMDQGGQGLTFQAVLHNLTIHNLSSYNFSEFRFNPETLKFHSRACFGELQTSSNCHFKGKILVISLNGQGTLLTTLDPTCFVTDLETKIIQLNGNDHLSITNVVVNFPVSGGTARFADFVDVHPDIIKALNRVIEENTNILIQEFGSTMRKFLQEYIHNLYVEILKKIPLNSLFPTK